MFPSGSKVVVSLSTATILIIIVVIALSRVQIEVYYSRFVKLLNYIPRESDAGTLNLKKMIPCEPSQRTNQSAVM